MFFLMFFIYIIFYSFAISRVKLSKSSDVSTYTLTLNSSFDFIYDISSSSLLPIKLTYEILFPYYIIPFSNTRIKPLLGRKIKIGKRLTCKGNRRGSYSIGAIEFRISDPLGLFSRIELLDNSQTIYVFPNVIPIERLKILLTDPFEGQKAKYRINFDYSYVAGVRDYTSQDSVSMIHWKQTAHRHRLTVKEFDFSASKKIYVALNFYKKSIRFQDYASSIGASIVYYANKYHLPFSVIINARPLIVSEAKTNEYHMLETFKMLSTNVDDFFSTGSFIEKVGEYVDFGSELYYVDKEINFDELLKLISIKKNLSKLNLVLLVDESFLRPNEKPPNYYFVEPSYVKELSRIEDVLRKENIFSYIIFGNTYLNILEQ